MNDAIHLVVSVAVIWVTAYFGLLMTDQFFRIRRASEFRTKELELFRERLKAIRDPLAQFVGKSETAWTGYRKFRILRKQVEADSICSFYLTPHDGRPLPAFLPGQYLTFRLDIPGQKKPVTRCYSLSDGPIHPDHYRVTIKKQSAPPNRGDVPPGVASTFFHERLNEGDIIDIRAPSGQFHLHVDRRTPVVLIGGGIGLTPMLSMLNYVAETGASREVWFFYGIRNGREHVMKDQLSGLRSRHPNIRIVTCYSDPLPEDREGADYDHPERVSVELMKKELGVSNFDFYVCGPPPMMESITKDLYAWGVPEERVHFESFGPASVKKVAAPSSSEAPSAAGLLPVNFRRSNKTVDWTPATGSLLELAEANGIKLDAGCRSGNCGTCAVAMVAGEVCYATRPGASIDPGTCLVCVAIPKTSMAIEA